MSTTATTPRPVRLGLRENLAQFSLLVGVNALVGGMIGQERTVLPLLAEDEFGLTKFTAALTFIAAFGIVKAGTNFFAGTLSDRYGRKGPRRRLARRSPRPAAVDVGADVGLGGVRQRAARRQPGPPWSTTVIMKIDLVGPAKRGLAMGLNEAAGYGAVAITALATGYIAQEHGLRPAPFFLGLAYAGLGLGISALFVRETRGHARYEAANHVTTDDALNDQLTTREIFTLTSFREKALSSAHRPGSSTTSTTAWPGVCSRSSSPTPACRSPASGCWPPSTRRSGVSANSSRAVCRTGSAANR